MSDKPLIQQALANDLGALVMEMPAANAIPFLKAFWQIHCQEWHGLDRIRYGDAEFTAVTRRAFSYALSLDWTSIICSCVV